MPINDIINQQLTSMVIFMIKTTTRKLFPFCNNLEASLIRQRLSLDKQGLSLEAQKIKKLVQDSFTPRKDPRVNTGLECFFENAKDFFEKGKIVISDSLHKEKCADLSGKWREFHKQGYASFSEQDFRMMQLAGGSIAAISLLYLSKRR